MTTKTNKNLTAQQLPFEFNPPKDKCTFDQWTQLPNPPSAFRIFTIISVLTMLVILVVIGNALVIAAVMMRRRLRSPTGILILSLAVADLLVGLLVLPFSIANEVLNSFWIFGDYWCTAWLTIDIWMCTSSIYNLVAISIDRYIAIIKPLNYPMLVTKFRARCIVGIVWVGSFIICSPSFLLASSQKKKQSDFDARDCRCTPSNSGMAYILFSASSSFYIPMIIVCCVYVKIYLAASAATKSAYSGMMQVTSTAISNKTPKDVLMQNPSALSRANNIPTSRSAEKESETRKENRQDSKGMEISTSMTNYKGLNGSCTNLQFSRQREGTIKIHDTKRLQHAATVADFKLPIRAQVQDQHGACRSTEDVKESVEKDTLLVTTVGKAPVIKLEDCTGGVGSSSNSIDGNLRSNSDDYCANNGMCERETLLPAITACNDGSNAQTHNSILNQENNANPRKEKKLCSFGLNLLSRLVGRGPRRKAGCVYEKRLSLEIKAAKTVAIVTGCFIFCWLGFAILYGISFYISPNDILWSIVFWLGYLNSALNPIIYTVFNREFRTCFKKLLTCNHVLFKSDRSASIAYYARHRHLITAARDGYGYHSTSATHGTRHAQRISLPTDSSGDQLQP